ncbi:hypothetical protein ACFYN3_41890 [Streptomyces lavendulae]|uniref:hypothetical protein n=1 Tax=Streptomyces lavendulae TaxID=1914 RepID=UPI0033D8D59B
MYTPNKIGVEPDRIAPPPKPLPSAEPEATPRRGWRWLPLSSLGDAVLGVEDVEGLAAALGLGRVDPEGVITHTERDRCSARRAVRAPTAAAEAGLQSGCLLFDGMRRGSFVLTPEFCRAMPDILKD